MTRLSELAELAEGPPAIPTPGGWCCGPGTFSADGMHASQWYLNRRHETLRGGGEEGRVREVGVGG